MGMNLSPQICQNPPNCPWSVDCNLQQVYAHLQFADSGLWFVDTNLQLAETVHR